MSWRIPAGWVERVAVVEVPRCGGLSPRLAALAAAVPAGARVVDLGADHGLLGAALLAEGRAAYVCAVDRSPAALAGAREALAAQAAAGRAEVRLGDGFAGLAPGSFDCAVLAGLGAPNALDILARGRAAGHLPERVVVQPLAGEHRVRRALLEVGYGLGDEQLVADGGRLFLTLAFDRAGGVRALANDVELYVGPHLARRSDVLVRAWLAQQVDWLRSKAARVRKLDDDAARATRARLAALEEAAARASLLAAP